MKKVFSLLLALSMLITGSFGVMAQAQTIEPTNFDEINFQITSKENPDAYIESRFVPGNSAYARSSEEDGKTLVGYVDATVYVEETYTKGEDGNIFTTDSRLLSEEEVMSIGKSEFDVPVQSVQPRISTIVIVKFKVSLLDDCFIEETSRNHVTDQSKSTQRK